MTYEAYGAGGTGFVIECLTDNVNRSATEVRIHGVHGMYIINVTRDPGMRWT
jgi:hypothetical protein